MKCCVYETDRNTLIPTTHLRNHLMIKLLNDAAPEPCRFVGQLENTESGNGIRERKRKRTVRAHAHDLNEWAGQPINGRIEICSIKFLWFHVHCISERD